MLSILLVCAEYRAGKLNSQENIWGDSYFEGEAGDIRIYKISWESSIVLVTD